MPSSCVNMGGRRKQRSGAPVHLRAVCHIRKICYVTNPPCSLRGLLPGRTEQATNKKLQYNPRKQLLTHHLSFLLFTSLKCPRRNTNPLTQYSGVEERLMSVQSVISRVRGECGQRSKESLLWFFL